MQQICIFYIYVCIYVCVCVIENVRDDIDNE